MERKITFEVREYDKTIFPDDGEEALSVCGRDDATDYLARIISAESAISEDEDILYLTRSEYNLFQELEDTLKKYWDKDMKEVQKAQDMLEDLREARRHTATIKDFQDFSASMDATEKWIEEHKHSEAQDMYEYLNKAYYEMLDLVNHDDNEDRQAVFNRYRVAIILSE